VRDRLRSIAEATGLLDVRDLRRRVASLEEALPEHRELQRRLEEVVGELERSLAQVRERR
jgi:hypothetical protein